MKLALLTKKFSNLKYCAFKTKVTFQQYQQCQSCSQCHYLLLKLKLHLSLIQCPLQALRCVPLDNSGGGAASREHWMEISYWTILMKPYIQCTCKDVWSSIC